MRDGGRITSTEESSFRKTMNILFPFAVYFVVHDLAQIVLAFLAGLGAGIFEIGRASCRERVCQYV